MAASNQKKKKRMASRPCCAWFMTHLTSALVKPQFISSGLFLISYSTICLTAQSAPWGKPWQFHLPAHASTRRRRAAHCQSAQGTYETSQCSVSGSRNILCSHSGSVFRCLQPDSSSGARGAQSSLLWLSGQREADSPLPKSPWASTKKQLECLTDQPAQQPASTSATEHTQACFHWKIF